MTNQEIFQKLAEFIKGVKLPEWLINFLQALQDIAIERVMQIGKAYLEKLKEEILKVAKDTEEIL